MVYDLQLYLANKKTRDFTGFHGFFGTLGMGRMAHRAQRPCGSVFKHFKQPKTFFWWIWSSQAQKFGSQFIPVLWHDMAMAAIFETKTDLRLGSLRGGDIAGGLSPRGRSLEAAWSGRTSAWLNGFSKQPNINCRGLNRGFSGKIHLEIGVWMGTASTFQHPMFDYWMVDPAFQVWKPSGNRNPRNPTILLVVRLGIHLGTPRALCNHWAWVNLLLQHGNGWAPRMTRLQEWDFTCFAIWVPSSSLQTKTKKISASPKSPKKKLGRCELNNFQ